MATGNFGNIRPADVSVDNMEVFYTFQSSTEEQPTETNSLSASEIITQLNLPQDQQVSGEENLLEGSYSMRLPATIFNQTGVYTIYIYPKRIRLQIQDCGVLSNPANVKGIVVNSVDLGNDNLAINNALQGYRIEYINSDGTKLRNVIRFVSSSNRVVPVSENIGDTSQSSVRYRFDDSGNLLFLTLDPSDASSLKPNATPFIGVPNQTIYLTNTFFNPKTITVELKRNDLDKLYNVVVGNQLLDVQKGIITYSDPQTDEIIEQVDVQTIETNNGDQVLYEIKTVRENIDETQDIQDVLDNLDFES